MYLYIYLYLFFKEPFFFTLNSTIIFDKNPRNMYTKSTNIKSADEFIMMKHCVQKKNAYLT